MTLEENEALRFQLERSRARSTTAEHDSVDLSLSSIPPPTLDSDPEIATLDKMIEHLTQELEEILEETSAHQRAISFARAFIEEDQNGIRNEQRISALREQERELRKQNAVLSQVLENSFGQGASALILKQLMPLKMNE